MTIAVRCEVDSRYIALHAIAALAQQGELDRSEVTRALKEFEIDPNTADPVSS